MLSAALYISPLVAGSANEKKVLRAPQEVDTGAFLWNIVQILFLLFLLFFILLLINWICLLLMSFQYIIYNFAFNDILC